MIPLEDVLTRFRTTVSGPADEVPMARAPHTPSARA